MAAPAWESAELAERIRWFIRLRWAAVGAMVLIARMATAVFAVPLDSAPLYLTALAVALYNGLFWLDHRRREGWLTAEAAVLSANLQIAFDLVALTVLLHYSGGAENPFASYYVFHLIIASILLSRGASYLQAAFALGLFGGLILFEYTGALPHVDVWGLAGEGAYRRGSYLLAVWTALGSTLLLAVYFATSITSRLRARETQVLRLKGALEAEASRLQEAYRACVETERAKSRYLLKVGHEVRAPLSAVQSLLRVIQEGLAGELPAKARDLIVRAAQRVEDLLGMVGDLLDLARAREAPARERRPVDLRVILENVLEHFRPEAEERRVTLSAGPSPEPLSLQGDAEGLTSLFTNLLSNAVRYTPAGGKVEVSTSLEKNTIVVRVADTGIGIAPEELTRIWEEFFRSPRARETAREGTGLGLAIVQAVVQAHGGGVSVESEPGRGATFTVLLPREAPGVRKIPPSPPLISPSLFPPHSRGREGWGQRGAEGGFGEPGVETQERIGVVAGRAFFLEASALSQLLGLLTERYQVVGPVLRGGMITYETVHGLEDLALGWREETEAGRYRLRKIEGIRFAHLSSGQSVKRWLHPPRETLFTGTVSREGFALKEPTPPARPLALFGLRSCDLAAVRVLDKVFVRPETRNTKPETVSDRPYQLRSADRVALVAQCTEPGATCFCASMGTGPRAEEGFDLALTELPEGYLLEVGSETGRLLADRLPVREATAEERSEALRRTEATRGKMGRQLTTEGLPEALRAEPDHPVWAETAKRCLGCTNCTQVCPTCFCYTLQDRMELDGMTVTRERGWDSCFNPAFAAVHGGDFRPDVRSRYRHWVTHKLSTWWDQFGVSGCVGCGRCITWCPTGIDITAVANSVQNSEWRMQNAEC